MTARPGTGDALQLLDPAQDNARASNWGDGLGWRFRQLHRVPVTSRLQV
jgi:hypothetical protein